jgi:hypothetical protein
MANDGLNLGNFILGLLKSKEKKKKYDKAKKDAAQKVIDNKSKETKKKIAYWDNKAKEYDDGSEAQKNATEWANYYRAQDAGITVPEPTTSSDVQAVYEGKVGEDDDRIGLGKSGENEEDWLRGKRVREEMIDWWRKLDDDERKEIETNTGFNADQIPSLETILKDIDTYDNQLTDLKKKDTTQANVVSTEKAQMDKVKKEQDYKANLEEELEHLFATLQYTQNMRNSNIVDDAKLLEKLQDVNDLRSRSKYSKPIVGLIKGEDLDHMYDLLVMYERLFGTKYKAMDSLWDYPIVKSGTASKMTFGEKDIITPVEEGAKNQRPGDARTLRDIYDDLAIDKKEQIEDPDGNLIANPNYMKPILKINDYLSTKFPRIYKHVQIVDKETEDYDLAVIKRQDILSNIKQMHKSALNTSFVSRNFIPQTDQRQTITDNRELIDNPNFNQMVPVDNPNYNTAINNPYYDENIAQQRLKDNQPYNDDRKEIDDGTGNMITNPFFNMPVSKQVPDWRRSILQKDENEFIANPTHNQQVSNPGFNMPIVQYPYISMDEDENK